MKQRLELIIKQVQRLDFILQHEINSDARAGSRSSLTTRGLLVITVFMCLARHICIRGGPLRRQ